MIFYVTVLRALAAILITNAHYVGVYPTDIIANGGLLGDVIFFAVSGFCLFNIKFNFLKWYIKRIKRIYPAVWIITAFYLIIHFYYFSNMNIFEYFIYPTYYHFIASIIVLYVVYYIIMSNKYFKEKIIVFFLLTVILQTVIYIFLYDKSFYHIDTVREPMIRFLFMQAMLIGAYYRKNHEKYLNKNKTINWIALTVLFIIYFGLKITFSRGMFTQFQIINQYILIATLYFVFRCFSGIDSKLENMQEKIKKVLQFIASITLEIYLVQYPIIPKLSWLPFPINWIVITTTIIVGGYILHFITNKIIKLLEKLGEKLKNEDVDYRSIKNK